MTAAAGQTAEGALVWTERAPSVDEYVALRAAAGLGPRSVAAARIGLARGLFAVTAHEGGDLIAMGRIVGDGGCFALVTDVAVRPDRQGRGLGDAVVARLVAWCEAHLPATCHLSLLCQPDRAGFYARYGFAPQQGMERYADRPMPPASE